jgi:FkbM family methyltransferase
MILQPLIRKAALLAGTPWPPENLEHRIYHACIQRGDTCYDVGANVGDTSLLFAALTGRQGRVYAFEPSWKMYHVLTLRLQRRLGLLRSVIVPIPAGVADKKGELTISIPNGFDGLGSLANGASWADAHGGAQLSQQICQITTIDSLIAESRLPPPDFVKIDVEGAELLVLRGARDLLSGSKSPMMLIEMHEPWQRAFGYEPWEPVNLLKSFGYNFLFTHQDRILDFDLTQLQVMPAVRDQNVVVYHPARHLERVARLKRHLGG